VLALLVGVEEVVVVKAQQDMEQQTHKLLHFGIKQQTLIF